MDFVILCSSNGTTFQAVLDALADGSLEANCVGLITDKEERGCVEKANSVNLPVTIVKRLKGEERALYDKRLHEAFIALAPDAESTIVACMGWMFILSSWFIQQCKNRILNVHPSLLPKYPGAGSKVMEETLASDDTEAGMTIHLIDEGVDTGRILVQKNCSIQPDDSVESLWKRIQELEKEWYPKILQQIHTGEIQL